MEQTLISSHGPKPWEQPKPHSVPLVAGGFGPTVLLCLRESGSGRFTASFFLPQQEPLRARVSLGTSGHASTFSREGDFFSF